MNSTVRDTVVASPRASAQSEEISEGLQFSRYRMLEELPGLAFGVITVVYIVVSLVRLAL